MKKKGKGFFRGCICILVFAAGICFLTKLTDPGYSYSKNKEFMEDSEMYDVLFFGNSHMANGVFPMELWHDYGIVSYNLGGFGNLIPATYWMLENVLDMSDPKLVVLDCHNVRADGKAGQKEMLHNQMDCLPLTVNKARMIRDLIDDPKEQMEFFWHFAAYHDRWWDLDQADFEKAVNIQKGAEIAIDVVPPNEMTAKPETVKEFETTGAAYLRRFIEECQSRGIEVMLTYLPFPATEEDWQESLYIGRLAKEYGVPYINFLELQVVNLTVDCSDKKSHLNGSGARKVTDYIGQYIEENYDIPDRRGDETYAGWNEDYGRYTDYKLETMAKLETLDKYLMMLADPAFDCCIYVNGKADIWRQNEMYMPLLNNIADGRAEGLETAAASGSDYFLVVDRQRGEVFESVQDEELNIECSFGKVRYQTEKTGKRVAFLQDEEENLLHTASQGDEAAIQIFVIDAADGSVVEVKRFDNKLTVYAE